MCSLWLFNFDLFRILIPSPIHPNLKIPEPNLHLCSCGLLTFNFFLNLDTPPPISIYQTPTFICVHVDFWLLTFNLTLCSWFLNLDPPPPNSNLPDPNFNQCSLWLFNLEFCQAQSQPQQSWTEIALISLLDQPWPTRPETEKFQDAVLGWLSLLFKVLEAFYGQLYLKNQITPTKANQTYKTKNSQLCLTPPPL